MKKRCITSRQNDRVQRAASLRDRRQRQRQERVLIEGLREIRQAIGAGVEIEEAFVCEALLSGSPAADALDALKHTASEVLWVSVPVFEKLAYGDRREGLVAVAKAPQRRLADLRLPERAVVAILEGVEKPGNLGAIVRSADAAGLSALVVAGPGTDPFNPATIRASLGTVFRVPVCVAEAVDVRRWLAGRSIPIYAADPAGGRIYTQADLRGPCALVLGSEAVGLSDVWKDPACTPIRLPLLGAADSLNVSTAAAVLFYEALRQRTEDQQRTTPNKG